MKKARYLYLCLLLAQLLISLHQLLPHHHGAETERTQSAQLLDWFKNLVSADLGEAHLENIRPSQDEEQKITFAQLAEDWQPLAPLPVADWSPAVAEWVDFPPFIAQLPAVSARQAVGVLVAYQSVDYIPQAAPRAPPAVVL